MRFLFDHAVADWVGDRLDTEIVNGTGFGVIIDDEMVFGIAYHDFREDYTPNGDRWAAIAASVYSTSPRWCSRTALQLIFRYPFVQMDVTRFEVSAHRKNKRSRRFIERLGFVYEGMARKALPGGDAAVYSMLKHECRWLNDEPIRRRQAA